MYSIPDMDKQTARAYWEENKKVMVVGMIRKNWKKLIKNEIKSMNKLIHTDRRKN